VAITNTRSPVRATARTGSWSWLGLAPFASFLALFFLLPTGALLFNAFRRAGGGYGLQNLRASLSGAYLTGLEHSIKVSAIDAVLAAVLGTILAQVIVSSGSSYLRRLVNSAAAVLANFGGLPLAFLFVAAIGNAGVLTAQLSRLGISLSGDLHLDLYGISGVEFVYLYFLIPLMVLVITPALEGLRPSWQEAAENLGATRRQYWRLVAAPVLAPSLFGSTALLFCSSFSAYATAEALTNGTLSLTSVQIGAVLSGNVLTGQENVGAALALDMIIVVVPLTLVYVLMERRTARWLR
jgi:putative spermidine/putrescine transport system permease protein